MKDYSYFIPGYTGFCPDLREHFGQTYGHATRHVMQEKPHLKERLAPVFYNYRRGTQNKKAYGKYCDHEKEKYDPSKMKRRMETPDPSRGKFREDFDGRYVMTETRGDGDRIRRNGPQYIFEGQEYIAPGLFYIEGIVECPPGLMPIFTKEDQYHVHHPFAATPRAHLREYADVPYQRKDIQREQKIRRVPRVKPHRTGGVVPKYTGHIPGMLFSFGESYGPASDRLLRRHHDYMMKHEKRKT